VLVAVGVDAVGVMAVNDRAGVSVVVPPTTESVPVMRGTVLVDVAVTVRMGVGVWSMAGVPESGKVGVKVCVGVSVGITKPVRVKETSSRKIVKPLLLDDRDGLNKRIWGWLTSTVVMDRLLRSYFWCSS